MAVSATAMADQDMPTHDLAETGEQVLDTMSSATRTTLPNGAALVLAMTTLRAVAASHGLDADAAWCASS